MQDRIVELEDELEFYQRHLDNLIIKMGKAKRINDMVTAEEMQDRIADAEYTIEEIKKELDTVEQSLAECEALGITSSDSPIQVGYKLAGMSMRDFL